MNNIFPKLLANNAIKNLVGEDILRGKHSHAYIIDGPDGSGKHTAAMQIAMAILCENKNGNALPCGNCASCKKIAAGFSTSVELINRGSAATLQVEVIRNMLAGVSYLPEDGDYKIYIIEEAERMTTQAQNSLLLTLEEPPHHAVFILLTTDAGALLETIRSRTHILKTELLTAPFILKALYRFKRDGVITENNDDKLNIAASAAMGSLGNAIALCSKEEASPILKHREIAEKLTQTLLFSGSAEAVTYCRSLSLKRDECESVLFYAMASVRDYITLKSGTKDTLVCTDIEKAQADAMKISLTKLYVIYSLLEAAQNDICKKNASVSTVLCTLAANAWKENR